MGTVSPSSLCAHHEEESSIDELVMQQNLLFSESLKDLKNLRSQLYSAAEYFELAYNNRKQKQMMMDSLKDYTVEALVSTVDHLGSVSYKANDLLNERVEEVSGTELRVSCVEQRIKTCQDYIDREGRLQQSPVIKTPKFHKHCILSGSTMTELGTHSIPIYRESRQPKANGEPLVLQPVISSTVRERPPLFSKPPPHSTSKSERSRSLSPYRKARSPSPSPSVGNSTVKGKRPLSPVSPANPLLRTASLSSRAAVRSSSNFVPSYSGEIHSVSLPLYSENMNGKEAEKSLKKSRGFLKSLLTRRRSRNDESLYSYLDEY
ncbi:probable protein ABIL3 isoform X2 [Ananas comosus]|uniref:Probable protein ABIL3 isoform X2 n=1 Tax=Ananas comosus TaxID=4615 RepID=A0A6P5EWJ2_ANACO|nr:probable protein ABIL3 isoform X2 [Ananas comosus]